MVEPAGQRAPRLAPVEASASPPSHRPQRLPGPSAANTPHVAVGRVLAGLLEDRQRVEVRLEDPRHREVGGRDAGQRGPQVCGAARPRWGQAGADLAGQVEGGGHVTGRATGACAQVDELAPLLVGGRSDLDGAVPAAGSGALLVVGHGSLGSCADAARGGTSPPTLGGTAVAAGPPDGLVVAAPVPPPTKGTFARPSGDLGPCTARAGRASVEA